MLNQYISRCLQSILLHTMPKAPGCRETSAELRKLICQQASAGTPLSQITFFFDRPLCTVQSIVKRSTECGDYENAPRSGRPPKLTERALRRLSLSVSWDRCQTLHDITDSINANISTPVCAHQYIHPSVCTHSPHCAQASSWHLQSYSSKETIYHCCTAQEEDAVSKRSCEVDNGGLEDQLSGQMNHRLRLGRSQERAQYGVGRENIIERSAWCQHSNPGGKVSWFGAASPMGNEAPLCGCLPKGARVKIMLI